MVLGFIVVFTALGLTLRGAFRHLINSFSGYATTTLAVLLIAVGIAVIVGWKLPFSTPKLNKGGRSGSFTSMFVFGASYAVASLGCALGPFINTVLNSSRRFGTASALVAMVLFSLGMGLVITALTVSLAVTNGGLVKVLRRAMRYVDRLAGVFLLLAGIYLLIYGIEEIRISRGTIASSGITRTGTSLAGRAQDFFNRQDPVLVGLVLATLVAAATAGVLLGRRRTEPNS
jgi:cytochrome c biogenesis protein CcdA